MIKTIEINVPIRTVSESNISCHWTQRKKRKDKQKKIVVAYWNLSKKDVNIPCSIKLTRIAPRELDSDNLASSFKFIRDTIADLIKPGYAPGRADSKDLFFEYSQKKGNPKEYGIRIEIYEKER